MVDPTQLPLRDWHAPPAVGWWPLAPGWWILLISSILLLAVAVWLWRRMTRPSVKKLARKEIESLKYAQDLSDSDRTRELSVLIRRICLSVYPRPTIARLTGREWLKFLDQTLDEPSFSEGPGKVLIDAPYRQNADVDFESLLALCERWIEALPNTTAPGTFFRSKTAG